MFRGFLLVCFALCSSLLGAAPAATLKHFDVPAGDAIDTIKSAAQQAGIEIMFPAQSVRGVKTNAITGEFTPRAALDAMLAHTPLTVMQDSTTGALAVARSADVLPKSEPAPQGRAPVTSSSTNGDQTVVLSPFEVRTDKDTSYGALNSNSITRFNVELDKMPISADIFTADFMSDVGVTTVEDLLNQYGAGTGQVLATPDSDSNNNQPGDRFSVSQIGVRGLSGGNIRRDGFAMPGHNTNDTSTFDIERVEVIRGPQGLLYGAGGAGGVIVTTSKRAKFNQQSASVQERVDQYGSKQTTFQANLGRGPVAVVFAGMNSKNVYRRLFISNHDEGYYGQIAFKLPLRTTLRASAEMNINYRLIPTKKNPNLKSAVKGVPDDPRNGESLEYILATNQAGATNPATGAPYLYGALDNGNLSWENINSFAGDQSEEDIRTRFYIITADTVWSKWLSTNIGFAYDHSYGQRSSTFTGLTPPGVNGNPLSDWAVGSSFGDRIDASYRKMFRASFLVTKDLFGGRLKTQTAGGYDIQHTGSGATDYKYYLSDADGNIYVDPARNNLGRVALATQWWGVPNGPIRDPYWYQGTPTIQVTNYTTGTPGYGGLAYYTRAPQDPRDPAWVSVNNPLGVASGVPDASIHNGVSGNGKGNYADKSADRGIYLTNFTSWYDDFVTTLIGYRRTTDWSNSVNTSYQQNYPYFYKSSTNNSWNLGVTVRVLPWLHFYYGASATYNFASGANDPYGNPPLPTKGRGNEFGLKFQTKGGRFSGSLDYFDTTNRNQNYNLNGSLKNEINPPSVEGKQYQGPAGVNQWIALDQVSRGLELIMNAHPTPHWNMRFSATYSDGRILNDKKYGILYNNQFYTDNKGGVTYANGAPFLVPDPSNTAGLTTVNNLTGAIDPSKISGPTVQLTTAMIGDPSNPYFYAGSQSDPTRPNVSLSGAMVGTAKGQGHYVSNALRYFVSPANGTAITGVVGLPISQIQYNWIDVGNNNGIIIAALKDEDTFGYAALRFSLTNRYDFSEGVLRGLKLGVSLNDSMQNRTYYYSSPDGIRRLFSAPTIGVQVNPWVTYQHKFGRFTWTTQLNVSNLFNHYKLGFQPNNGLGFTDPKHVGASFYGQPRMYVWTNTISF